MKRLLRHVDFRSDTVTMPTLSMLSAIMDTPLGDDGYGEDPTVQQLEREVNEALGGQSVLTPSGTMGNQLAIRMHLSSGEKYMLDP